MIPKYARYALDHPVFDPVKQMGPQFGWRPERLISAMLTVNIGME